MSLQPKPILPEQKPAPVPTDLETFNKIKKDLHGTTRSLKNIKFFIDAVRDLPPQFVKLYSDLVNEFMKELSITQRGFGESKTFLTKLVKVENDKSFKALQLVEKSKPQILAPTTASSLLSKNLMEIGGKMFVSVGDNWILLDTVTTAYKKVPPVLSTPAEIILENDSVEGQTAGPQLRNSDLIVAADEEYLYSLLDKTYEEVSLLPVDTRTRLNLLRVSLLRQHTDSDSDDIVDESEQLDDASDPTLDRN